jgi:hypothetical protein
VNSQSRIITCMSNMLKVIGSIAFFTLTAGAVSAQSPAKAPWKVTGEIVSASKTTLNGFSAVSGATVFNNNRIRTGKEGAAVINLGRLGRIELGPDTDMTLRISEASIGGELRSTQTGQMVVSAQKGVTIAVNAAEGVVTTDGLEPAVLTIYLDGKSPRVIAHRGTANVVTAGADGLWRGKEFSRSPRGDGSRRVLAPGMAGAAVVSHTAVYAATRGASATPFSSLLKAGINYSRGPKSVGNSGLGAENFDSSITCRNNSQTICHKKSSHSPE